MVMAWDQLLSKGIGPNFSPSVFCRIKLLEKITGFWYGDFVFVREKDEIVSKRKYIKQNMKQKTPRSSEETKYHR
jgi:hypothetical protein